MSKRKTQRIARTLARSLSALDQGKARFDRAAQLLDQAIALGGQPGEIITLEDGRRLTITDHWNSGKNVTYRPARFARFTIEDYKEPKAPKTKPAEEPAAVS